MSVFEFPKDSLLQLSDQQLEEFVARLADAEVAAFGVCLSDVTLSGSINAPDGGVDVQGRFSAGRGIYRDRWG